MSDREQSSAGGHAPEMRRRADRAGLVGRRAELDSLLELIVAVARPPRDGDTDGVSSLVVVGEPGVGKTALLGAVADLAAGEGVVAVRADGCHAECDIPFAALSQILAPLSEAIAELPVQLGKALSQARDGGDVPETSTVCFGLLQVLVQAARDRPVLLIVDDTDHLDGKSLRALLFVARRIRRRERVAIVLAGRGAERPLPADAALPTLALGPLLPADAETLFDGLVDSAAHGERREILETAAGNPLAIEELAAAGTGRPLQLSARVDAMFAAPMRALGGAACRLLLCAAVAEDESPTVIQRAAGEPSGLGSWAAAERAGYVTVDGARVIFRHPLARAVAYAIATAKERRDCHLALAAASTDPTKVSWYRAHACADTDEEVAASLSVTAQQAGVKGAHRASAQAWRRAAECSPVESARVARFCAAQRAAAAAGDAGWVAELHRTLGDLTDDPTVRLHSTLLHAAALMMRGLYRDAIQAMQGVSPLIDRVEAPAAVLLAAYLSVAADESGIPEHRDAAREVVEHPALTSAAHIVIAGAVPPADLTWQRGVAAADGPSADLALQHALRAGRARSAASAADLHNLGLLADRADDIRRAIELLTRCLALGHQDVSTASAVGVLARLLVEHGSWSEAGAVIERWGALAEAGGWHRVAVELGSARAVMLALHGECDLAHDVLAQLRSRVDLPRTLLFDIRTRTASAIAAMAEGEPGRAYRQLRGGFTVDGEPRHPILSPRLVALLATSATEPDERADAALVLERVRAVGGNRSSARMRLLLHHADALLGPEQDTERHFRLALADPTGNDWPIERARVRLHYGEWLRRRRRSLEAREMLGASLEVLDALAAHAMADRVRAELRAAGHVENRGPVSSPAMDDPLAELTPQQREIVELAAAGMRNREIAQRLFLSPRTVGSHLHHAYPKLGISGRHQLGSLLQLR